MSEWLPIDTAPKENAKWGRGSVLVYKHGIDACVVAKRLDGAWVCAWDHDPLEGGLSPITHWMPLPEPPVVRR